VETLEHILLGCARSILCCKILNACTALNVNPQLEIILKNPDIIEVVYANIKRKIYTVSKKTGPLLPFAITPTVLVQ